MEKKALRALCRHPRDRHDPARGCTVRLHLPDHPDRAARDALTCDCPLSFVDAPSCDESGRKR